MRRDAPPESLPFTKVEAARRSRVGEVMRRNTPYFTWLPANSYAPAYSSVGADAHIGPAVCTVFYGNLRRIRRCPMGRCGHRPLQIDLGVHTDSPENFRIRRCMLRGRNVRPYRSRPIFKRLHKILRRFPLVCSWDFGYDDSTEKKTEGNLLCSIFWSATMRRISSRL